MEHKRLTRSEKNKILAGVCGGISEYLGLDANLIRLIFLLLMFIQPSFIILYLLLAFLLPQPGAEDAPLSDRIKSSAQEIEDSFEKIESNSDSRLWLGIGLIVFGAILLLNDLGIFWFNWNWLGAIVLIGLGIYLLLFQK